MGLPKAVLVILAASALQCEGPGCVSAQRRSAQRRTNDVAVLRDQGKTFVCDQGSRSIPSLWVSDDYCDCADGSDEQNTSACSFTQRTPIFECASRVPEVKQILPSSRVNDGICDCCDGSDEVSGLCEDTCHAELERVLNNARANHAAVLRGHTARQSRLADATAIMEKWQQELASEMSARAELHRLELRLKVLKESEEREEAWEKLRWSRQQERRSLQTELAEARREWDGQTEPPNKRPKDEFQRGSVDKDTTSARLDAETLGVQRVMAVRVEVEGRSMALSAYLAQDDLTVSGVKARQESTEEYRRKHTLFVGYLENGGQGLWDGVEVTLQVVGAALFSPVKLPLWGLTWSISRVKEAAGGHLSTPTRPTSSGQDSDDSNDHLPWYKAVLLGFAILWEEGISAIDPRLDYMRYSWLRAVVGKAQDILAPLRWAVEVAWSGPDAAFRFFFPGTIDGYERLEAALLRKALDALPEELSAVNSRVDKVRERSRTTQYGPDTAWVVLEGRCFDFSDHEHTYRFCPFKDVKQGTVLCGQWGRWGTRARADTAAFTNQVYTGGHTCYQGPPRSVEVAISCAEEDKVVGVREVSKCVYDMEFQTPLACTDSVLEAAATRLRTIGAEPQEDDGNALREEL